jgi:ATP-binding cassette subfamily F protein 3
MLSVSEISVQFGSKKLFENVSFIVNPKDRIGLVGSNGSGKSTLLKIISGISEPDNGEIALSKHITVGYLPQDGITYSGQSIYDEVYSGAGNIAELQNEIDEINRELAELTDYESDEYKDLAETLSELQHKFELLDGYRIKSSIEKILTGLGFSENDFTRLTDEFSGGWQMRIALAKLLLKQPSVLLLDEPTNHLDIESLLWLEEFLKSYSGAIILVSHDKKFLDNITTKTIEIYAGNVTIYSGNYSFYLNERKIRKDLLMKRYENQQRYIKQQERFITRFRYKASKASNVQSRIKLLNKLDRIEIEEEESAINFNFPPATHSGRKVLELKNITKRYGDNLVLEDISLEIERGEKIGLVGNNGAGKSTLARIIRGTEDIQQGTRKLGFQVELEYYSQHQAETLNTETDVLGTLDAVAEGEIRKHLRTILGSFLFKGDDVYKQVSVLSGGEKSRLALARMLLKKSNFLILDEPTNHLDMNSKQVLMNALRKYEGTILIISHDREFLDGIVTKIIEVKNKNIKIYLGNCSYYLQKKYEESGLNKFDNESTINSENNSENINNRLKKLKDKKREEAERRNQLYKMLKPYKDKLKETENLISNLETAIKETETEMASDDFYKNSDYVKSKTIEYNLNKDKLNDLYHQWFEINNEINEIEKTHNI